MDRVSLLILMAGLTVAATPGTAQERPETRRFVLATTLTGAAIGVGLDVFYLFTLHTGYEPETTTMLRGTIVGVSSIVQAGVGALAGWGLGELLVRYEPAWPVAVVGGAAYGAVAGALGLGLTMGTIFAIAIPTGAITVNPDADFMGFADTWWEGMLVGLGGGGSFGALYGAVGGAVIVPLANLVRVARFAEPR